MKNRDALFNAITKFGIFSILFSGAIWFFRSDFWNNTWVLIKDKTVEETIQMIIDAGYRRIPALMI